MVTVTNPAGRDNIPRVQHIYYFEVILRGIAERLTFDALRAQLRHVALELRAEGRAVTSGLDDGFTFWSPTADAIGELMKLGLVEVRTLPSKRNSVEAHRDATYSLSPAGQTLFERARGNESSVREALTPLLLKKHFYLSSLCKTLADEPILIPEYTEEDLKQMKRGTVSWTTGLGEDAAARMRSAMTSASASAPAVTIKVREALAKRFPAGAEPTSKDILDTVLDALVAAALESRGLRIDAVTFNVLTSWGRQLFIMNESRYVKGMPGRTVWSTADIQEMGETVAMARRNLGSWGNQVAEELQEAYRDLADGLSDELGGKVRYPYLEIFKVRALAAYRVRVNDPVVDRVIADIADGARQVPFRIELALGASSWRASSEAPFRLGSRRYYVMLIKPDEDTKPAEFSEVEKEKNNE
jgi:hypothetical protein